MRRACSQPVSVVPTGSLSVHQYAQCGARRGTTYRANSPKQSAETSASHPPRSSNQPGSVKCSSVTIGSIPASRSRRHQRT